MGMKPRSRSRSALYGQFCDVAFALPGAEEHFPWGERVAKVRGKVFIFFGRDESDGFGFSVKLPQSADGVLALPFAKPTGYGLGKSGWVSIQSDATNPLPLELLTEWVHESYRAIAPKKLIRELDGIA